MKLFVAVLTVFAIAAPAAAQDIVLYGRVRGSDHSADTPSGWNADISVARKDGNIVIQRRRSQGDLFACSAPPNVAVRLIVQAVGYESRMSDVPGTADWTRKDFVLEQITPEAVARRSSSGQALEAQLQTQAEIAQITGRGDILDANLSYYKRATAKKPDLSDAVGRFERSEAFQRAVMVGGRERLPEGTKNYLMESQVLSLDGQQQLMNLVANPIYSSSIRERAITVLSTTPKLDPQVQPVFVNTVRDWSLDPSSPYFAASVNAVAKKGSSSDQAKMLQVIQDSSRETSMNYLGLLEGSLSKSSAQSVIQRATTSTDSAERLSSLRALKGSTEPGVSAAAAASLSPTQPEAVRLEAIKVLVAMPLDGERRALLKKVAGGDASAEIRSLALGALSGIK